jgi:hypothetical protein
MVITGVLLAGGAAALVAVTVGVAAGGSWRINPLLGVPAGYGVLACWLLVVWRSHRAGVFVSEHGIRIRHLIRTRTIAWPDVAGIDSKPALLLGTATDRTAIWVRLRGGGSVETPVQRSGTGSGVTVYKMSGQVLNRTAYDKTLHILRSRLRETITNAPPAEAAE